MLCSFLISNAEKTGATGRSPLRNAGGSTTGLSATDAYGREPRVGDILDIG